MLFSDDRYHQTRALVRLRGGGMSLVVVVLVARKGDIGSVARVVIGIEGSVVTADPIFVDIESRT